jgi:hypothetical protein
MPNTDKILLDVFNGTTTRHKLPKPYYNSTRVDLMDAVKKGMGNPKGFEGLLEDLGLNAQAFAGAKTYNLVRDLEALQKGNPNFKDYEPKAQALVKQYDIWGEAEVKHLPAANAPGQTVAHHKGGRRPVQDSKIQHDRRRL